LNEPVQPKAQITFGKFANVDLRIARVTSATLATGTNAPSRVLALDLGPLGTRTSVAQFAIVPEHELVGSLVVACINLGPREIGAYVSEALVLGVRHPQSPPDQAQALPLSAPPGATPGEPIF
jgi:tRNA-binding protein